MKIRILLPALGLAASLGASCQRIPPSVSIPGYGEKEAAKEESAHTPLGAPEHPTEPLPGQSAG